MNGIEYLPAPLRQRLGREAGAEPILWAGQSDPDRAFRAGFIVVPLGLAFLGFAVMWNGIAVGKLLGLAFAAPIRTPSLWFTIPFGLFALGVGVAVTAVPWINSRATKLSAYALTPREIIEVQLKLPRLIGPKVVRYQVAKILQLRHTPQKAGRGDIRIEFSSRSRPDQDERDMVHLINVERSEALGAAIDRLRGQ